MKEIILVSKAYGTHSVLVDDEDYEYLSQYTWFLTKGYTNNLYAKRAIGYGRKSKKHLPMHRELLGLTDRSVFVDHKDGNGLNNQRSNIRIATPSQNAQNRKITSRNNTGFIGVRRSKSSRYKPYAAALRSNGRDIFGGYFSNPIEAANKYNELAIKYNGEYASLNVTEGWSTLY